MKNKDIEKGLAKKGLALAKMLKLKKNKQGYYITTWGIKTDSGLWLVVNEFMKNS